MNQMIEEANKRISIYMVCSLIGVDVSEGREGSSIKTYCPFGMFYHSDGGKEAAFRVYGESNSAYCFSCKKYFTPVTLYSSATDVSYKDSAEYLLQKIGYKKPTPEEIWDSVQPEDPDPDKSMLNKALRIYCERVSTDWKRDQFNSEVAGVLDRCLSMLDSVSSSQDADYWLTASKEVMSRVLRSRT